MQLGRSRASISHINVFVRAKIICLIERTLRSGQEPVRNRQIFALAGLPASAPATLTALPPSAIPASTPTTASSASSPTTPPSSTDGDNPSHGTSAGFCNICKKHVSNRTNHKYVHSQVRPRDQINSHLLVTLRVEIPCD